MPWKKENIIFSQKLQKALIGQTQLKGCSKLAYRIKALTSTITKKAACFLGTYSYLLLYCLKSKIDWRCKKKILKTKTKQKNLSSELSSAIQWKRGFKKFLSKQGSVHRFNHHFFYVNYLTDTVSWGIFHIRQYALTSLNDPPILKMKRVRKLTMSSQENNCATHVDCFLFMQQTEMVSNP